MIVERIWINSSLCNYNCLIVCAETGEAPFRLHAGIGFLAAQTSGYDGKCSGQVGSALTLTQGQEAAQRTALDALARIHQALDGFDRLVGLLQVAGHVCSAPNFFDQPEVLDGASRVFNHALGDRGRHSRTAYAPTHLPKHITIEMEITFAYREMDNSKLNTQN